MRYPAHAAPTRLEATKIISESLPLPTAPTHYLTHYPSTIDQMPRTIFKPVHLFAEMKEENWLLLISFYYFLVT